MLKKWLLIGLLCCPLVVAAAEKEKITLNFVNADIESVIKAIGMISGKNFVLDPRVKGTINIVSSSPVSKELTYPILLSALRLQGFAAIEGQGVIKIVPEADAKQNYSPTTEKRLAVSGDKIVTQVYPLRYESASQLVPVLRPLISPNNTIAAYVNTNTLVITDYADNVRRINKIIDAIDQPNIGEMVTVKLEHASATDLAQALNRLMSDTGVPAASAEATRRIVAIADSRTNSVLLRSDNPSLIMRARAIIAGLDVATSVAGNIHVVYLKNADATKLAQTLRAIMSGDTAAATGGVAGQPAQLGQLGQLSQQVQPTGGPAASGFIQADAATNSLIITAPDNVYNTLRAAIDKLDARRAQVYVEALIAEVSTDKAAEFGIQWQFLNGVNSNSVSAIGGTNLASGGNNIIAAAGNLTGLGQGLNIGITKGMITLPGIGEVINLGVLARALATDANTNILSTPNLLTLDNEEAKIIIGQNVPFVTGSYAQTGTTATATPFQTIERKDVGLMLKIKPQISEGGSVKLQIYQEVSSVVSGSSANTSGPTTNKRSIESTVLVDDGRIIVLGGLIQDDVQDGQNKVPLLGDLPVLGGLFRYDTRQRKKTNLMVFLRPYVLKDAESSTSLTDSRYSYIRDQQDVNRLSHHAILPDMPVPQLPSPVPAPQTDSKIQPVAP
jgi:general secretion pathway protein D